MFLLDTNVISELRKAGDGRADVHLLAWIARVDASSFYLSVITLLELELGVLRMERRDIAQGSRLREWMDGNVIPEFSTRILAVDAAVALRCARMHARNPQPERDAMIAATALVHGMTVATRNVRDFRGTGVRVVNPWIEPAD